MKLFHTCPEHSQPEEYMLGSAERLVAAMVPIPINLQESGETSFPSAAMAVKRE